MIFHDIVTVGAEVYVGRDSFGNEIWDFVEADYPGEVTPVDTTVGIQPEVVITRYRAILPPGADFGEFPDEAKVTWRGREYTVEGSIEEHNLGGRIHHIEVIIRRAS